MSSTFLSKNLKYLRLKAKYSQEIAAEKLGTTRGAYKDYELGTFPKPEMLLQMADFYAISLDQLLRTDLEMLDMQAAHQKTMSLNELKRNNQKVLVVTVDSQDKEYIDFIPEKAKAGYTTGYANPEFVGTLPKFRLPQLPVGTYRAFQIQGDSMPPVTHQSVVVGKYVDDVSNIKNLSTYVIITLNEGIVYKRVMLGSDKLLLISDNPEYKPYSIATSEVMELWAYHCHISYDGNNTANKALLQEFLNIAEGK
ncbi:MAG: LexA family transcriptional regulator [Bacteroidota bacterium]|nr:LexA family transcriptional regulator [Bacteroidota bacterium]